MRLALLAALAVATPSLAQITPIWSSTESEVIPYDAHYSRTEHVLLDDGSAFMVASETSRSGLAGTVRLDADGSVLLGQFGHQPLSGGRLSPETVLATQGNRVLLGMTELENTRALVVMVDAAGQIQWVRPRYGRQARFLGNGDVLLASGNELMRLKGSNGDLVWLRNLLDLQPDPAEVAFQLPTAIDTSIPLSLFYRESSLAGGERFPDPLLVSLDAATGALQWQRQREAAPARVFESCAPLILGADTVHAYFESAVGQVDVVFERRSGATGARLWATRVPAVDYTDGPCGFVATSTLLALSSRDETAQSTLVALNHAGALQWRTTLATPVPAELRAAADGALLVASQQLLPGGFATIAERRRASDGGIDWAVEIPGRAVDWRVVGGELRIAWSVDDGAAELHLQRRVASSGALVEAHMAVAEGLAVRPADMEFIDGVPYAALAGIGVDQRGVRVRRLDPENGAPLWSQQVELSEQPNRVTGVNVSAGSAGRLIVVVYYDFNRDPAPPELRQAILSVNADNGTLLWQTALSRGASAQPISASDGSVHVRSQECLNPPACTDFIPLVSRMSAADGQVLWSVPAQANLLGVRANDLVVNRFGGSAALAVLSPATGSDLWSQELPTTSQLVATLSIANGDLHSVRQSLVNGRTRTQVDRRMAVDGVASWTIEPGAPTATVRSPLITRIADGDVLLTSRMTGTEPDQVGVSRPLLARIDGTTGAIEWLQNPTVFNGRWLTVRAINGATGSHQWARSLRLVDDREPNTEERYALTTVALNNGFIGAEHQYAQNYDAPLGSPALGLGSLTGVSFDGSALVENRSVDARGLNMPQLQRWPAPSTDHGDILLRRVGTEDPITALGSSTEVVIEVEGNSTAAYAGIVIGFASTEDGLKAQLRGCEMVFGSGTCPTQLGSSLDQTLTLGASALMRLRYEIHDPNFGPAQANGGEGARGVFHVDPPYDYGDADLGNNLAVIHVALGGTSNGFE